MSPAWRIISRVGESRTTDTNSKQRLRHDEKRADPRPEHLRIRGIMKMPSAPRLTGLRLELSAVYLLTDVNCHQYGVEPLLMRWRSPLRRFASQLGTAPSYPGPLAVAAQPSTDESEPPAGTRGLKAEPRRRSREMSRLRS
jgi:hypothetical protein